jgi:TetR/AcrR family transcriptional regulator, repressor for uid operon
MPKLKPATQAARRDHILDAAHACFARGGFHATTMQDICKEAAVSPGALYVYFDSKEALIAGLCERDRTELAQRLEKLAHAPDFIKALEAIGETYFVDDPVAKQRFVVEMGVESTRNPRVAEIFLGVDKFCRQGFKNLFQRLADEGRIKPKIDIDTLSEVFHVIGDGMFWRRAIMPGYDVRTVLPVFIDIIGALVNPQDAPHPANDAGEKLNTGAAT